MLKIAIANGCIRASYYMSLLRHDESEMMFFYFFKTFLEDTSPFRGVTNTPVLDFW